MTRHVIIGGGPAAINAIETIREFDGGASSITLVCDVHSHMRGYVVVSPTPWIQVCSSQGRFRLENVPDGRYRLNVWHEMGEPLRAEIAIEGGQAIVLPELVLAGPLACAVGLGASAQEIEPAERDRLRSQLTSRGLDAKAIYAALDLLRPEVVISGCQTGADTIALNWASERGVETAAPG